MIFHFVVMAFIFTEALLFSSAFAILILWVSTCRLYPILFLNKSTILLFISSIRLFYALLWAGWIETECISLKSDYQFSLHIIITLIFSDLISIFWLLYYRKQGDFSIESAMSFRNKCSLLTMTMKCSSWTLLWTYKMHFATCKWKHYKFLRLRN